MRGRSAAELHALKCELAGDVLCSSGQLRLRVMGWSMLPTLLPGDTLLIETASSERVGKGDIVLFRRDRRLFVHRISEKSGNAGDLRIITQGDGMRRPDPPISAAQLLGKVAFVVRDGRCMEPARNPGLTMRAVAALARRSSSAARVIVGVHNLGRAPQEPNLCQS
jgi:signal peptidase I